VRRQRPLGPGHDALQAARRGGISQLHKSIAQGRAESTLPPAADQ
jgi:hypothetical protein